MLQSSCVLVRLAGELPLSFEPYSFAELSIKQTDYNIFRGKEITNARRKENNCEEDWQVANGQEERGQEDDEEEVRTRTTKLTKNTKRN